jgi:hypothetical protein
MLAKDAALDQLADDIGRVDAERVGELLDRDRVGDIESGRAADGSSVLTLAFRRLVRPARGLPVPRVICACHCDYEPFTPLSGPQRSCRPS